MEPALFIEIIGLLLAAWAVGLQTADRFKKKPVL